MITKKYTIQCPICRKEITEILKMNEIYEYDIENTHIKLAMLLQNITCEKFLLHLFQKLFSRDLRMIRLECARKEREKKTHDR